MTQIFLYNSSFYCLIILSSKYTVFFKNCQLIWSTFSEITQIYRLYINIDTDIDLLRYLSLSISLSLSLSTYLSLEYLS